MISVRFSLAEHAFVSDPICGLNAALEGRYAIERELVGESTNMIPAPSLGNYWDG